MFLAGVIHYFVDRHYHPEAASIASFEKLLAYFGAFLLIDFITSTIAFSPRAAPSRQQGRRLAAIPHLATALRLSSGLLDRPVQDPQARHRRQALQLGQAGAYRKDE